MSVCQRPMSSQPPLSTRDYIEQLECRLADWIYDVQTILKQLEDRIEVIENKLVI